MIKQVKIEDKIYPNNLRKINNPPQKLYVMGNINLLNKKGIAIIGSRCCTKSGEKIAEEFAKDLSEYNLCIISGMAKGIDSAAHIGALKVKEDTIAVLGSGFNNIYPEENINLFKEIIKNNGLVITEYEPNIKAESYRFIERNKIVSGLSEAVLVIEAKYRSGTSITANLAKQQGKKVFCIAHGIEDRTGIGTNKLIKEGAILVTQTQDILNHFNFAKKQEKKTEKNIEIKEVKKEYMPIYEILSNEAININEICKKTNMNISKVNYILTMLELEGYIKQIQGKNFIKGY